MTITINTTAYGKVTKRHQAALEELMGVYAKEYKDGFWFAGQCFKTRKGLVISMLELAHKGVGLWNIEELLTHTASQYGTSLFVRED